jgi:RNA polymerase sigma-70 factor (ECF subfamily)
VTATTTTLDTEDFAAEAEKSRRELLAHCYRMLGSADEAEDVVQETFLRAWRSYRTFEGRSSVRVWLYRIATNACLTALQNRKMRPLPSGIGAPGDDPSAPLTMAGPGFAWLQPIADGRLETRSDGDPAAVVARREDVRLALVASLQHLPPRQRAVLLLREVLELPALEVGQMLGMSTAAVKSALQRARGRIEHVAPDAEHVVLPTEPEQRALLDTYIEAFEKADSAALEQALTHDAILEVTPSLTWFSGLDTCLRHLRHAFGPPHTWRMIPTRANGQPAAVAYLRDAGDAGLYHAYGIAVLGIREDKIERITAFGDTSLVTAFGHPARWEV